MLIRERLDTCDFSNSERGVVDFILEKRMEIRNMTIREIAKGAFASPSTLVRIAGKMGFGGWNELKEAYLREEKYLQSYFQDIDANLPFARKDSIVSIASKIALLKKEAIDDTRVLLTHDDLQEAVMIMRKASSIDIYAVSKNLILAQEFQYNMRKIGKRVEVCLMQGEVAHAAYLTQRTSCGIIISYSGETPVLLQAADIMKKHQIPIIAITNIGESSLSGKADCVLRICTREKQYSKISSFTTDSSIAYLLDVLYSCMFALHYEKNLQMKIDAEKATTQGKKQITVEIIRED